MSGLTDLALEEKLREIVISELGRLGARRKGVEMIIICPFHDDTNPSLRVHIGNKITPGGYHCFSCGAHGGWNDLAEKLKLQKIDGVQRKQANYAVEQNPFGVLDDAIKRKPPLTVPHVRTLVGTEPLPPGFQWRGLGKTFLERYGARFYWDRGKDMEYLYFPLIVNQEYVGYTIAALRPCKPKYETFADTHKTWLFYDQVEADSTIIIVEGHFDDLRSRSEALNSMGMFGTENWSPAKKQFVLAKRPKKVITLMDGDEAGYAAARKIYADLVSGVDVEIIDLPYLPGNELDPGNMPHEWIEYVRSRCV